MIYINSTFALGYMFAPAHKILETHHKNEQQRLLLVCECLNSPELSQLAYMASIRKSSAQFENQASDVCKA